MRGRGHTLLDKLTSREAADLLFSERSWFDP